MMIAGLDGLDLIDAARAVSRALAEDMGSAGDLTTQAVVPGDRVAAVAFVARCDGVMAGAPVVEMVYRTLGASLDLRWTAAEGARFCRGDTLGSAEGPAGIILSGERVALNFLQRLCGVATLTRRYADEIIGTGALLLDTRKTTPGLRRLERYAVRMGGGCNHRMGLFDRVLVKDNHLAVVRSPAEAVHRARERWPSAIVEVEVTNMDQFRDACTASPDWILLDNMSVTTLRACVHDRASRTPPVPKLEASGGVRLENIRDIALTGVDAVSVGALTHGAVWADIALEVEL